MKLGAMNNPRTNLASEIDWIARSGFDFIDLTIEAPAAALESTDWKAVGQAIADAGLGVVCHAAPYFPVDNPSPAVRQAALDELRRCVDAATVVGADLLTTHFLGWPSYMDERSGYEFYRQFYAILIQHGQERGVRVTLENSTRNSHQLKYFREIFQRLPGLRLTYDIGHGNIQTAKSMTRDYLFALADHLAHVHLSDNDGQGDDHLPIGAPRRGGIDLGHELRNLRSFRYDGTVTLEVFGDRRWLLASAHLVREGWEQST